MALRAVGFDIGGVLTRSPPAGLLAPWQQRLGMPEAAFQSALNSDPANLAGVGGLSEAEASRRYAIALGLCTAQVQEFMADIWDWYCGNGR